MFTRKQPEQNAPAAPPIRQLDPASIEHALAAIASFSGQMQEITELFARGYQNMSRQFDETAHRLDRAVVAVATGEARIAAQVEAFERVAVETRRIVADHERASRELAENFRRTASELAGESIRPLKAEVESVSRHLSDATSRVAAASSSFTHAVESAVGVVNSKAERMLERQAEAFSSTVAATMASGQVAMTEAAASLDSAAGALTRRILATAEAQDAKLKAFEALTQELGVLKAVLPSPEATARSALRIEEATAAMSQASAGIGRAVGEILIAQETDVEASRKQAEALAGIAAGHAEVLSSVAEIRDRIDTVSGRTEAMAEIKAKVDVVVARQIELSQTFGGTGRMIEASLRRNEAEGDRHFAAFSDRIDGLQADIDALTAGGGEGHRQVIEAIAGLAADREAMKRLTIKLHMMSQDTNAESQRAGEAAVLMAERLDALAHLIALGLEDLKSRVEAPRVPAAPEAAAASAAGLPLITGEKESLQRVLMGFRLLLRDIGGETGRLRDLIDGVAGKAEAWRAAQPEALPPSDSGLGDRLDAVAAAVRELEVKIDGLKVESPFAGTVSSDGKSAASLPVLHGERESLQRLLVGFRLQLMELDQQTSVLREKIEGIRQPDTLVLSPEIDASLLAPLNLAAERISEGVAETLSQLEQRLTEPVSQLAEAVADNAKLLLVARDAMAAPAGADRSQPVSVADAVASMQQAARTIDERIGHVDQLLAALRKGGAVGDDTLRDTMDGIAAAAAELRREAGDFLAIGAALTHELDASSSAEAPPPAKRRRIANTAKIRGL